MAAIFVVASAAASFASVASRLTEASFFSMAVARRCQYPAFAASGEQRLRPRGRGSSKRIFWGFLCIWLLLW
jgi:hypothetical protein